MKSKPQKGKKQSTIPSKGQVKPTSLKKYYYLLGLFTFFIFANSIGNGYNMDDGIVTNGHELTSQGFSALGEIFTSNYYKDDMGYAFGYRPMVHASFAIEHELFGEKPGAGHFINVILFALIVVLFFKLLIKWVGEKNLLFAGIATILFAIHPVHTEVVNSLKNRDELLAFFFVIWSGLSAHKYLEKGKWTSIVSIVVVFSCAMLSKKSVYPMAVVLPLAIILLKEISVKQLVILGAVFIVPAAVIGSEFQLERLSFMIILPSIALLGLYAIKHFFLTNKLTDEQLVRIKNSISLSFFIVLIGLIAAFTSSFYILTVTIPLFLWLFKINFEFGLLTMVILSIGLEFLWLKSFEIQMLQLIIGLGYSLYTFLETKKLDKWWFTIGIITSIYFLIHNYELSSILLLVNYIIFIFLLKKRALFAIVYSIFVFGISLFMSGMGAYPIYILLISGALYIYEKIKNKNSIQYIAVGLLVIAFGFVGHKKFQFNNTKPVNSNELIQPIKKRFIANENVLKEGRQLELVENTLVLPHTKEESIGTGFATLGEYFRLMSFPYELSFYYGYAKTDTHGLRNFWVWLIILIHVGMLVLAFFHMKKNPMITIGVFWYLACILLFSNWVELVAGMVGERLAFTASAGFCVAVTGVISWLKPDLNFKNLGVVGYSLIVVLITFTGRTIIRNTDWKDTMTLMGNDIKHLTNSAQANNIYAMHLMAESTNNRSLTAGQIRELQEKAITHFDQATTVSPDYYNVYIDKGRAAILMRDYELGKKSLEKAIKIDPKNIVSYYNMLDLLNQTGNSEQFLKYSKDLFKLIQNEYAYGALSRGYFLTGDLPKSKALLEEGIKKFPKSKALIYNLTLLNDSVK